MKVKIHNDGKGKHSSFESYLDIEQLYGFGENEQECLLNLQLKIDELIKELQNINQPFKIEYVDCLGNKIDKK